ncbi:helix-turn-helix transcriptional regulator [Phascolarctobacterium succinatutens]|jgi:transcriptional regulator with XRE-family HTH domain|uniref:helix-turn-helix transcriptional regulator n=1 Tax=Phascolarctobacterium succinatutens TaxID=626940 RepID=UPI00204A4140|nr:MAG TPA: Repressor protein CI [Caudoviricetes sp.]
MGISENIKLLREQYGLSQKELGQIAGVSDKAVSTWEQGIKEPRMGAIQKIADHFGIQKSNIIEDNGLQSQSVTLTPPTKKVPKDLKKILEDEEVTLNGRMMSSEDKEKMMRIIEAAFYEAKEMNKRK